MASHQVQFASTYPALLASASAKHPHIIDLASYTPPDGDQQTNMKLQDAVVTMLYQISTTSNDVLADFLDAGKPTFKLIQKFKDTRTTTDKLVIAKDGNKVIVGIVTEHKKENCLEFDNLVRYTIAEDGSWNITYMSYRDYFRYNWNDVWAGKTADFGFGMLNMKATPGNDPSSVWELFPFQLADNIMTERLWDAEMSECTIT